MAENPRLPTFNERTREDGRTVLRVANELRQFLADAPEDDEDAVSLLNDCDTLERVGRRLLTCTAVTLGDGIPAAHG